MIKIHSHDLSFLVPGSSGYPTEHVYRTLVNSMNFSLPSFVTSSNPLPSPMKAGTRFPRSTPRSFPLNRSLLVTISSVLSYTSCTLKAHIPPLFQLPFVPYCSRQTHVYPPSCPCDPPGVDIFPLIIFSSSY